MSDGSTKVYVSARIQINMTDRDVIERVAEFAGGTVLGPYGRDSPDHSPFYTWAVQGKKANDFLVRLLPLMCSRRQEKIREVMKEIGL